MRAAATLLVYVVLTFILLTPLSLGPSQALADDGDSLQNLWILWWGATHWQLGYPDIFQANGYYPHPSGLLYSESQLLTAVASYPLFATLGNPVLAFNLITLFGLALSGFCAHTLFRELTGKHGAAFLAGTLFAFNAYHFSQLPRSQLIQAQWIPLGLLCLHLFFVRPSWRRGVVFAIVSLFVGLSSFYYLLFYAVAVAILLAAYIFPRKGAIDALPKLLVPSAVSGVVFLAVALPYLELFSRYEYAGESADLDLATFFLPSVGSLLYSGFAEYRLSDYFLGYASLVLGAIGLISAIRDPSRAGRPVWLAYAVLGGASFLFAAGPNLFFAGNYLGDGPFALLQLLSPFAKLREPARFAVIVYLMLALFAARGLLAIVGRISSRRAATAVLILTTMIVLAEQRAPFRTKAFPIPTADRLPEAYRWLGNEPSSGAIVDLPVWSFRQIRNTSLDAFFSTFHRRPIPFGKPSFYPPALELLQWELRDFPDDRSLALLRELDFELAVVHPKRWRDQQRAYMRRLTARAHELRLIRSFEDRNDPVWAHYELGGERIYRIVDGETGPPLPPCECIEIERESFTLNANGARPPQLAVDGDRGTKWTTSGGQGKGNFFEIIFDRPRRPVRVEIEMAFPYGEFARNLEMNGYNGQRAHRIVQVEDLAATVALVQQLVVDPTRARLRYNLKPMTMDRLRLFINRTEEATIDWSIAEIHVYETDTGFQAEGVSRP